MDGYLVHDGSDIQGSFLTCRKCGRRILVEIVLCGVSHNTSITATCAQCIGTVNEEFKARHPEAAQKIEEFIRG